MASSGKIVVFENEPEVRSLIETFLSGGGYQVVTADESTHAVDLVRRERPDLVLCDISMPTMDGYAVLTALQSDPLTDTCPVVFLTSDREFTERVRAFRLGVTDYITKPFTRELLLRKVGKALVKDVERGPVDGADIPHDPPILIGDATDAPRLDDLPELLRTVLIVDDNAAFRVYLKRLLGGQGFTVYEARDGEEGLRAALEHRPWLILTDVTMPEVNGFEFCRRVREHSLISHTALVFLSGWDDYKDRYRGLELGADEFLSKQISARELLIRLKLILKRYADLGTRATRRGPGMEGGIEVVGTPGILQMCHQGRLSGVLTVQSGTRTFEARFRDGELLSARSEERTGTDALYEFLGWTQGRFQFAPGEGGEGAPLGESFSQLILEGCRRLDERRRSGGDGAPGAAAESGG